MLDEIFVAHPRAVGENYFQHQRVAFLCAARLALAGVAALVHGLIPCLFQTTASSTIARMHGEMAARHARALRAG